MPSKKPKKRPARKSSVRKATTRKSPARKGKAKRSATGKIPLDVLEKRLARLTRTVKARGGKVPA